MDEIYEFSKELVLMKAGRFVEKGPTKEIFKKPHFMETARLTGCKNLSATKRIDDHHIYATEWDIKLTTSEVVSPLTTHVGIRSHHLYLSSGHESNRYPYEIMDISEKPFEITFLAKRHHSEGNPLIWRLYKERLYKMELLYILCYDVIKV